MSYNSSVRKEEIKLILYRTLLKKPFPDYKTHLMMMKDGDWERIRINDSRLTSLNIDDLDHVLTHRIDVTELALPDGYYRFNSNSERYFIVKIQNRHIKDVLFDEKQKTQLDLLLDLEQTKDEILFEKGFYQDPSIYDSIDFEKELTVYQSSGRYDDIENQEEVEI